MTFSKAIRVFVLFLSISAFGQTQSTSPYSIYGLGANQNQNNSSLYYGGGLNSSGISPKGNYANFVNPAANIDLLATTFELDFRTNYSLLDGTSLTQTGDLQDSKRSKSGIKNASLAFPMGRKFSAGFSYRNYFSANNVEYSSATQFDSLRGGLNQFQTFVSYKATDNFSFGLSLEGYTGKYNDINTNNAPPSLTNNDLGTSDSIEFETVKDNFDNTEDSLQFVQGDITTKYEKQQKILERKVSGFAPTLGTLYNKDLNDNQQLVIGVTYRPETKLTVRGSSSVYNERVRNFAFTRYTIEGTVKKDSITNNGYVTSKKTIDQGNTTYTTVLPQRITFGASLNKKMNYGFGFETEFEQTSKTQLSTSLYNYQNDRFRISTGGWWIPDFKAYNAFFNTITYRGGLYFEQTPYKIDGKNLQDLGLTLGAGIPIGRRNDLSELSLGLNLGQRIGGPIDETYFNMNLGVVFNEDWFRKREIN